MIKLIKVDSELDLNEILGQLVSEQMIHNHNPSIQNFLIGYDNKLYWLDMVLHKDEDLNLKPDYELKVCSEKKLRSRKYGKN